jgi:hypothetical protein
MPDKLGTKVPKPRALDPGKNQTVRQSSELWPWLSHQ